MINTGFGRDNDIGQNEILTVLFHSYVLSKER